MKEKLLWTFGLVGIFLYCVVITVAMPFIPAPLRITAMGGVMMALSFTIPVKHARDRNRLLFFLFSGMLMMLGILGFFLQA